MKEVLSIDGKEIPLLLLALFFAFWSFKKAKRHLLFSWIFRIAALGLLLLAIWNPRIHRPTETLDVVLGVDYSHSVGQEGKNQALLILKQARRLMDRKTRTGLLFFGRQPSWEFFPSPDPPVPDFSFPVGRGDTDIAAALQAALAQIGGERQARILLISDGNENVGEVARSLPILRSHGVQVWVHPVNLPQGRNEIYLRDLVLPHQVDRAESFEVRGAVESLYDAPARIKLLRNGVIEKEREVLLRAGTNWVSFRIASSDRGTHTFELIIESPEDTLPENNLLQGVVEVKGPSRVLYIHSQANAQRLMARVLKLQGYSVVESSPDETSLSLPELSAFDLLVLDNIPATRLSNAKMEAIEKYVRDLGGGLIVVGGPQSYGAGGYDRTPMERVLPLEMRPPSRRDFPHVALLFVLDKSESMGAGPKGATKLDLGKSAAVAAAELLKSSDQVGILAFDAGWDWVLAFRQVGRGESISQQISSIRSDGGTDLYKAMVEAHRSFSAKLAVIKHALVISDGLTEKRDFHSLVAKMARDGVTVSTVAVGEDSDVALMAEIARDGKGRSYVTADPEKIPQIFTTETLLISRDLLIEKFAEPKVVQALGPLKGFSQTRMPAVRGYVLTHAKPRAEFLMKVEENPLLVSWRYGLGRVVAFTSDLSGRWGREWVAWEEFPKWAGQLARYAMRKTSENQISTRFSQEGEEVKNTVDLLSKQGGFVNHLVLKGTVVSPDGIALTTTFVQSAPGRYETVFSASKKGVYLLTIHEEGNVEPLTTVPFISSYPKEYRQVRPNLSLLSYLAEATGGEVLEPQKMEQGLKRLFTPQRTSARISSEETWWPLSGLALALFLCDLALRRLAR
jgi:uncharacterized membrane protein